MPSWLKKNSVLLIILCLFLISEAQDYHFSQFYHNSVGTNPALTGAFDGVVRASVVSRSQWLSVSRPFLTLSAEVDGAVYKDNRRQELVALGIAFNGDKAGDVDYRSVQAIATVSYVKNIGRQSRHKLGIGFYAGVVNNSFDFSSSTWDEQFANGAFQPQIVVNEQFVVFNRLYADFGAGLFWSFLPSKKTLFRVSVGASHLNMPFYEFGESESRLPIKYTAQFYSQIAVSDNVSIYPMLHVSQQRKYNESIFGCNVEYFKKKNSYTNIFTVGGGISYRWNDALIFNGFISWQGLRLALAYDVNVSAFRTATMGRGALELALTYTFRRKSITRLGKEPCPYDIM